MGIYLHWWSHKYCIKYVIKTNRNFYTMCSSLIASLSDIFFSLNPSDSTSSIFKIKQFHQNGEINIAVLWYKLHPLAWCRDQRTKGAELALWCCNCDLVFCFPHISLQMPVNPVWNIQDLLFVYSKIPIASSASTLRSFIRKCINNLNSYEQHNGMRLSEDNLLTISFSSESPDQPIWTFNRNLHCQVS